MSQSGDESERPGDQPGTPPAPPAPVEGEAPGARLSLRERLWAAVPTTGLSLANKCLLLFGGAVILIVALALVFPLLRMNGLVERGQLELSRQMVDAWLAAGGESDATGEPRTLAGITARRVEVREAESLEEDLERARAWLERRPREPELQTGRWEDSARVYRYVRPLRAAPGEPRGGPVPGPSTGPSTDPTSGPTSGPDPGASSGRVAALVVLERRSDGAVVLLLFNTVYLFLAGMWVLGLALLVFYFITSRIILSPVRRLRETAERVREGDLSTRSDITTNDEFEELAETFNAMLADLEQTQSQQRAVNAALDVKLSELAEANVLLYESARMKGEFVANVSHELRTPLNSIIGFAELLLDIARADARAAEQSPEGIPPALARRQRYLENILTAGRSLLSLIEDLLEMAKIEAGKVEVRPEAVNTRDACEALIGLIQPLADRKGIRVELEVGPDLPLLTTDPKRLHQILFNFLSNAVKFTPARAEGAAPPRITLRAERLPPAADAVGERVRLSVIDQGPGIPREEQGRIFEKFHQVQRGENKQPGTGLGLSICKELAHTLQGEIQLVSDVGVGSMFSLILPVHFDRTRAAETGMERRFRAALTGRGPF